MAIQTVQPPADSTGSEVDPGRGCCGPAAPCAHADTELVYLHQAIVECAEDAIFSLSLEGKVTSWNPGAERMFGYTAAQMLGRTTAGLQPVDRPSESALLLRRIAAGERVEQYRTTRLHRDGREIQLCASLSPVRDSTGVVCGMSVIARDVTRDTEIENDALRFQALVESSSDAIISKSLDGTVTSWNPAAERLYGYRAAEIIGQPLLLLFPEDRKGQEADILSRIRDGQRIEQLHTVRRRKDGSLVEVVASISPIRDRHGRVIGASSIARPLLRGGYAIGGEARVRAPKTPASEGLAGACVDHERLAQLRRDLPEALKHQEFLLHYQPVINLRDSQCYKAEALLRWQHPQLGLLTPDEFLPLAEASGLIAPLGDWVLDEVLRVLPAWVRAFGPDFQIGINLSPQQFIASRPQSLNWGQRLSDAGLEGRNLVVEITESSLMERADIVEEKFAELTRAGIELAIDDFGTGFSSLAYLNRFCPSYLKIDRSLVSRIQTSCRDLLLCEAIVAMARKLSLLVIAEGVETAEQLALLDEIGCDYCQGHFVSRPVDARAFTSMLRRNGGTPVVHAALTRAKAS